MATPVYPSLSSHAGALTEPEEVIPSILRQMFANPASISDYYEERHINYRLSFRRLEAKFGTDPEAFCSSYHDVLKETFARYWPTINFKIDTYYKIINEQTGELEEPTSLNAMHPRYTVFLDIQKYVANELIPIIVSGKITIDHDKHEFKIDFTNLNTL